ncbi:hypothetical protein [Pyrofollis japonicus]|uniref:hypothetical protein n=1 Tax=Pyrofollis japonicus TaxID=3060460 RepID=UPI00295A91AB|nr:hypothetical protein [Pyrofollis japonicus]
MSSGSILLTLLYNGKPITKLNKSEINNIFKILKENKKELIKPIYLKRKMVKTYLDSTKALVLLPCNNNKTNSSLIRNIILNKNVIAIYRANGYDIFLTRKHTPALPAFSDIDREVVKIYQGNINGDAKNIIEEYTINWKKLISAIPEKAKLIKIIDNNIKKYETIENSENSISIESLDTGLSNNEYFIWDVVPWEAGVFNHEETYLGNIEHDKGVKITSTYWSGSDSFRIPPHTTRYEVYLVITANKTSPLHIIIELNGAKIYDDDYVVEAHSTLSLGTVVHTVPEEPGNYINTWSKITYSVTITSSAQPDIVIKAVPVVRSYIGDNSENNLVYSWELYLAGIDTSSYESINPPLRIIPQHHNTFLLRTPLAFLEGTASFTLTIYSSKIVNNKAYISINIDGLQICDGYTYQAYYRGAWRQVYTCSLSTSSINDKIINALREGRPLLLDVYIDSNEGPWFIDHGAILSALRRARHFETQPYLYKAVASYDTNDASNYQNVVFNPITKLYYAFHNSLSTVLVADIETYVRVTRPAINMENDIGPLGYLLVSVLNPVFDSLEYGPLKVYINSEDVKIDTKTTNTQLAPPTATANVVGKGSISYGTTYSLTSTISWMLGAASIFLSGGVATAFGVISIIIGTPSTFYKSDTLSAWGSQISLLEDEAEATWSSGITEQHYNLGIILDCNIVPHNSWQNDGITITTNIQSELAILEGYTSNLNFNTLSAEASLYVPSISSS